MQCKDIERLIIDSSERDLSQEEQQTITKHRSQCILCARFLEDWEKIRLSIKKAPVPFLTAELDQKTMRSCQAEINSRQAQEVHSVRQKSYVSIPRPLWVAIFALFVLTVILFVPGVKDLSLDEPLTFPQIMILTLILQNAVMLILVPIIIRKYGRNQGFRVV